jgi:hypothetical protein
MAVARSGKTARRFSVFCASGASGGTPVAPAGMKTGSNSTTRRTASGAAAAPSRLTVPPMEWPDSTAPRTSRAPRRATRSSRRSSQSWRSVRFGRQIGSTMAAHVERDDPPGLRQRREQAEIGARVETVGVAEDEVDALPLRAKLIEGDLAAAAG